ncbi:MAG TPA: hypothetical protein VIQ04_01140, partial [Nitrososphaeraceae archaeon]
AKEKGFDEPCFGYYKDDKIYTDGTGQKFIISNFDEFLNYNLSEHIISAPLYQQLINWFEKKDIYIYAIRISGKWQWKRDVGVSYDDYSRGDGFESKKQALNKAFEEAFKLIP